MNQKILFLILIISNLLFGQTNDFKKSIQTDDIHNFWNAFDEVKRTNDTLLKLKIFEDIYIKNSSEGLQDFIKSRDFSSTKWIKSFNQYPKFWESIRPKTEEINEDFYKIENIFKKFNKIYSNFNPPKIYYTIGILKGGGTVINGNLIIGTELAASNKFVNFSELPKNYQDRMKVNSGILFLTAHELVHTQQNINDNKNVNLLGLSLKEGSADFIAELILKNKVEAPYMEYGYKNECELWGEFKKEMFEFNYQNWLSNTTTSTNKPADLGYLWDM